MLRFFLVAALIVACTAQTTQPPVQPVTSLPGYTGTITGQYSGYINVNESSQTAFFYWFMESKNDPANDPVVLWMQGGPGCSGMLGMFQEHGPWKILPNNTLVEREFSWNNWGNVLYFESPAGVGYSYCNNTPECYSVNDNTTAELNYSFLQGFFDLFPQYKNNPLWITGESWGGVYVPTLVNQIIEGPDTQMYDSLQGFAIGNPVFHCPAWASRHGHMTTQLNTFYWHGMVSFSVHQKWFQMGCNENVTAACDELYAQAYQAIGPMETDDLFQDFCTGNGTLDVYEPVENCYSLDQRTAWYLNQKDVQEALHSNGPAGPVWMACDEDGPLKYDILNLNMMNFYNKFFDVAPQLRILIYSGDADIATCPFSYAELCLSSLDRPTVTPWTRWTVTGPTIPNYVPGHRAKTQVTAGYYEVYDTYTYCTVKGAGHETPQYSPRSAYAMITRFIVNGSDSIADPAVSQEDLEAHPLPRSFQLIHGHR